MQTSSQSQGASPAEILRRAREDAARRYSAGAAASLGQSATAPAAVGEPTDATPDPPAAGRTRQAPVEEPGPGTGRVTPHTLESLLALDGKIFVTEAFVVLLGRSPDAVALEHYHSQLQQGTSKLDILGRIRFSPEGRRQAVRLPGLLRALARHRVRRVPVVGYLLALGVGLARLPRLAPELAAATRRIDRLQQLLDSRDIQAAALQQTQDRLAARLQATQHQLAMQQDTHRTHFARLLVHDDNLGTITQRLDRLTSRVESLDGAVAGLRTRRRRHLRRLLEHARRVDDDIRALRLQLTLQPPAAQAAGAGAGAIATALATADTGAGTPGQANTPDRDEGFSPDQMYARFEQRFRGSREEIRERVSVYLPIVSEAGAGKAGAPIVDIGCGRGEWLEILREARLDAYGVDTNERFVQENRQRGLVVVQADAIAYLRTLPPGSVGAITGFHLIEHLPFDALIELFRQAHRVLMPSGLAIFETPNPENLQVGACYFYLDPTHLKPLPPSSTAFMLEACGFDQIQTLRLHPFPADQRLGWNDPVSSLLDRLLFDSRDYALIGRKGQALQPQPAEPLGAVNPA